MQQHEVRQRQSQTASQAAAATRSAEQLTGSQGSKGVRGQRQPGGATGSQRKGGGSAGRKQLRETVTDRENMPPPAKKSARQANRRAAQDRGSGSVTGAWLAMASETEEPEGPWPGELTQRDWVPETEPQG